MNFSLNGMNCSGHGLISSSEDTGVLWSLHVLSGWHSRKRSINPYGLDYISSYESVCAINSSALISKMPLEKWLMWYV